MPNRRTLGGAFFKGRGFAGAAVGKKLHFGFLFCFNVYHLGRLDCVAGLRLSAVDERTRSALLFITCKGNKPSSPLNRTLYILLSPFVTGMFFLQFEQIAFHGKGVQRGYK